MSCAWDLLCVTCDSKHGFDANHGDEALSNIAYAAPTLAMLAEVAPGLEVKCWRAGDLSTEWFRKHGRHELVPVNEYGDRLGECLKDVNCGACNVRHSCRAPRGHEGECVTTRKAP